jgi:hypothetical protein
MTCYTIVPMELNMRQLVPGVRVRFIGQPEPFKNVTCLLLVGRTGVILGPSSVAGMDWEVEMDEGCYDLDAQNSALVPIADKEADAKTTTTKDLEAV